VKTDLSALAGFRLSFDPDTLALETGPEIRLQRSSRTVRDLWEVLFSPDLLPADRILFYLDHIEAAPEAESKILAENELAFGFTLLPPARIGDEYVKTHGHSHPPVDGYPFSFPEIYAQISGRMWLFLQKHRPEGLDRLDDCLLVPLEPGEAVVIPPNHAHMQINPSPDEPSLTAGLYSRLFKPEFAFYKQQRGFAYYLLDRTGSFEARHNTSYDDPPPLRLLEDAAAAPYRLGADQLPLWSSLMQTPEAYAFLSHPEETARKFQLA
jgi:glucose-6-phosphate isomerase